MLKLKNSGYNEKYRKEILDSALKGFAKMLQDDQNDVKPLFRIYVVHVLLLTKYQMPFP
jgi:hypothetical protein